MIRPMRLVALITGACWGLVLAACAAAPSLPKAQPEPVATGEERRNGKEIRKARATIHVVLGKYIRN